MIFDETGPGSSNVGSSADEEKNDDDHAIETEESTLSKKTSTID